MGQDVMGDWKDIISSYTDKVENVLPDENVLGSPFWTLMEIKDGKNTGNYHSIGKRDKLSMVMLFPQKQTARWSAQRLALHSNGFQVRGVSAGHLEVLLRLCEDGYPLQLVVAASGLDENGELRGALMSPHQIREMLV